MSRQQSSDSLSYFSPEVRNFAFIERTASAGKAASYSSPYIACFKLELRGCAEVLTRRPREVSSRLIYEAMRSADVQIICSATGTKTGTRRFWKV